MNVLALDMASKTGWAHSNGASGVWDFRIMKDESSGMRLIRFEAKLTEMLDLGLDLIAFESVNAARGPRSNLNAVKIGVKLQAIVERFCVTHDIECIGVNLKTIKAHALGDRKGKRNKDAMVQAAQEKWPHIEILSDDHADALHLLSYVQEAFHV